MCLVWCGHWEPQPLTEGKWINSLENFVQEIWLQIRSLEESSLFQIEAPSMTTTSMVNGYHGRGN